MKVIILFIFIYIYESLADEKLFFSGHYRGRIDSYSGVNKNAYGDNSFNSSGIKKGKSNDKIFLQQIIAGVTYSPNDSLEYKLYMYDSRAWGYSAEDKFFIKNSATSDSYLMHYYDDHAELFETYVRVKNIFNTKVTTTIGRQQLDYGDRRIFGPGRWGNTMGWLWDATHFSYKENKDFIDVWYGQTRIKSQNDFSFFKKHRYQGIGIYSHFETKYSIIEPFAAWRNTMYDKVSPVENSYYLGTRIYDYKNRFIYDATVVKGFGEVGNLEINSYAFALKAGIQFDTQYSPKLMAGYIYASGDGNSNDKTSNTFGAPFGANDGLHYGRMDVMIWQNMRDLQLTLNLKANKKTEIEFAYHNFNLANANDKWYGFNYSNKLSNNYTHIGDEYDVIVKHKLTKNIKLLGIFAYLNAGDFIKKNNIAQNESSKLFLQFMYMLNTDRL